MSREQTSTRHVPGFSLVELMVALTVTLIIMGSVYGLMAQGQTAFGREPYLADRQQQIRIAMDRVQEDVLSAGANVGFFAQVFASGLDNLGPQGVRAAADLALGGANSDGLEIRRLSSTCAPDRLEPGNEVVGEALNTVGSLPADCFAPTGYVYLLYPDARAKFGWLDNTGGDDAAAFQAAQPEASQFAIPAAPHIACSVWFGNQNGFVSPNGLACPTAAAVSFPQPPLTAVVTPPAPCPACPPYAVQPAEVIRYELGVEADGTIALFRSATGGRNAAGVLTAPPGPFWQLIGSGIEDLQVEYRTTNSGAGWLNTPPLLAETVPGDIVLEVRVTLWARAITPPGLRLAGETRSQGVDATGVTAVRGSLVSIMAPRAVQESMGVLGQWK